MNGKKLVLVETVKLVRARYVVEVPEDEAAWALDVVTCNDAKIFSESFLDETIVSHRVVDNDDLKMIAHENAVDESDISGLVTREVDYLKK